MSNFLFCVDYNSWNNRRELLQNEWICELAELSIENIDSLNFIKRIFSLNNKEKYKEYAELIKFIYPYHHIDMINSCFEDIYNSEIPVSDYRGAFLEVFIYKFCLRYFSSKNLIREFNVKYGENLLSCQDVDNLNCRKSVFDVGIIPLGHAFECKFSPLNLKPKDLDVLICISRKTNGIVKPFLIIFDRAERFNQQIEKINQEWNINYDYNLEEINKIFFEDFHYLDKLLF